MHGLRSQEAGEEVQVLPYGSKLGRPIVGHLVAITRYPVKSMRGEDLSECSVGWHGLSGDRRWGLLRPDELASGFPWLTIRELPDLWTYQATISDTERPDGSAVRVQTPRGPTFSVSDPSLAAQLGAGVTAVKLDRGTFDAAPVSILSTRSVQTLAALLGSPLDLRRFRPNLVIEPTGGGDFPEDAWVGSRLRIGADVVVRVDQRDTRCALINVDPETGDRDRSVLRAVARHRANKLGAYGSVERRGVVALGDAVYLT